MIRRITGILGVLLMASTWGPYSSPRIAPATAQEGPPNIVFILADDLGYGDLGSYGQQLIATPHLDKLAARGMRLTQHYAGSTVCAPSRSVLMTGQHTGHTYVRGNWGRGDVGMADSILTLPEVLSGAGYHTAMIGKWGLGSETTPGEPSRQGFDHYYGYLDQVRAHNYYPEYLLSNGERDYLGNQPTYLDSSHWTAGRGSYTPKPVVYSQDKLMDEALGYLDGRRNREGPFFLYLPFTLPHNNGEQPRDQQYEIPNLGQYADKDWTPRQRGYAAMVSRLDTDVGRILDRLDELGLTDNTLVIFTSDNGPIKDAEVTDHFDSNGPLRGGKRDMYEGGIRVPLLVRWPGRVAAGSVNETHVSAFWDWLPTLAELSGADDPPATDGISLLPTLTGEGTQAPHDHLYWEFPAQGGKLGVRRGDWKAVALDYFSDAPRWELYDLGADPGETTDLAASHPDKLSELKKLAAGAHTPSPLFRFPDEPATEHTLRR